MIRASIERCFRLSLSIELELSCLVPYSGRAIAGRSSGLIGPGEHVCWSVRQFFLPIRHTSEITAYDEPAFFQDTMTDGIFQTFRHDHYFEAVEPDLTVMTDEVLIEVPFGFAGRVVAGRVIRLRMQKLLRRRNRAIRNAAESSDWKNYLPSQ